MQSSSHSKITSIWPLPDTTCRSRTPIFCAPKVEVSSAASTLASCRELQEAVSVDSAQAHPEPERAVRLGVPVALAPALRASCNPHSVLVPPFLRSIHL